MDRDLEARKDIDVLFGILRGLTNRGGSSGANPASAGVIAGTVRTQAGATGLTAALNRVDTSTAPAAGSTLGDGVRLPAATGGQWVVVINNTANLIQLYASGTDTINGVVGATGLPLPVGDVAFVTSSAAGSWQFDAGMGSSGQLPIELGVDGVTAAGVSSQANATQLVAALNRVTVSSGAGTSGVKLPASAAGMDVIIENHSGNTIIVYGLGADQVDDIAAATGIAQMDSSVVIYTCYAAGKWYTNGAGTGYARNPQAGVTLQTVQFADGLTALGAGQATALQLTAAINNVTTVAVGTGVNLPASSPGLSITIENNGVNPLTIYPSQIEAATINGIAGNTGIQIHAGTTAVFNCTFTGAWFTQPASPVMAAYSFVVNADANFTLSATNVTGGVAGVDVNLQGAITAGRNVTTPTAAQIVTALHAPTVGTSYRLRITNNQAGAFAFTVVAGAGVTLLGNLFTINQNTWREFVVSVTNVGAGTQAVKMQSVATGTYS